MNYAEAGFATVTEMVVRMAEDPDTHLDAFLTFCHRRQLLPLLRARDWRAFAVVYNGPANAQIYADKLAAAYEKHCRVTPVPQPARPVSVPTPVSYSVWQKLLAAVWRLLGWRA
jgi:hypothetical protein